MDEDTVQVISYKGVKKEDLGFSLESLQPVFAFLDKDEYSQIPFSYFRDNFPDTAMVQSLAELSTDVIVPLRTSTVPVTSTS